MKNNTMRHHIDTATLLAFSAGTLNEALSAVVAAHVSSCSHCAREVEAMDMVGSAMLAGMPVQMTDGPVCVPEHPTAQPVVAASAAPVVGDERGVAIPAPIRRRFGITGKDIRWQPLAPGVWHHRLPLGRPEAGDLRLLRIAPGYRMLEHGHGGTELTLVLQGAFSDSTGEYLPGDIQEVADETEHCPVADRVTGCVCLIASEERARFRGVVGKIVQAWTGL
ncbi:MAG: ChrR family anti-sigma-E factor [Alphaproteobacteria bacterium]